MGTWGLLVLTMVFASLVILVAVILSERFGGVWAPIWIVCFLIGMSILFDYGGVRQTEFFISGKFMLFACGPMMWPVLALGQDYINEFYGKKLAYNYTIGMFLAKVGVAAGTLWIIKMLPIPSDAALGSTASAFNTIMGLAPRINIASIIAVVAAFGFNAWWFDLMRKRTQGRHLWLRNITSSALGLTIDAFVFFYGAFAFVLPLPVVWQITTSYLLVCYSTVFIDSAFLYLMVWIKKNGWLGVSHRLGQSLTVKTLQAFAADQGEDSKTSVSA